jgi:hypothetical protein
MSIEDKIDKVIKDYPIELFDPMTRAQETALSNWFKKLREAVAPAW